MKREDLIRFAAAGVAKRVADIERELAAYWLDYPELFLTNTSPQLLRAEQRNGNGHGSFPVVRATKKKKEAAPTSPKHLTHLKPKVSWAEQRRRNRHRSKLMLEKVAKSSQPVPGEDIGSVGLGALVRRGYLKKTGKGYVRTDKEFVE